MLFSLHDETTLLIQRTLETGKDDQNAQELHDKVERVNELFGKGALSIPIPIPLLACHLANTPTSVHAPNEAIVDSDVLLKLSMQSAKMARAMKSGSGAFDVDDFVNRLVTFMGGRAASQAGDDDEDDDEDGATLKWERIGWKALAKSRRVPAMDFMCVF